MEPERRRSRSCFSRPGISGWSGLRAGGTQLSPAAADRLYWSQGTPSRRHGRQSAAVNIITDSRERVAVLAVVGDGLPDPPEAAYRFRVLSARVGSIVRVPFIASLRATDDPEKAQLPRKARRALREIRATAFEPVTDLTQATKSQGAPR